MRKYRKLVGKLKLGTYATSAKACGVNAADALYREVFECIHTYALRLLGVVLEQ